MKLILPIAGVGIRLRPFTFSKPKGFVKIAGSRGVDHILEKIGRSLDQKTPLCLIVGYQSAQIRQYVSDLYTDQFSLTFIEQIPLGYQGDVPYFSGLGHAILLTKPWFVSTPALPSGHLHADDTLIFLGDMIPVHNYQFVLDALENEAIDGVIGTMEIPMEKISFYGIVECNSEKIITKMVEKPKKAQSNLAIAGVYAFKATTMQRLYEILDLQYNAHQKAIQSGKKQQSEFQFTPSLQQLVDEGYKLQNAVFKEGILDFGRPDALLHGNRVLLEAHNAHVAGTIAHIEASVIADPCAIGKGTHIKRSVIGPYVSIGKDCEIDECMLSNVVIGDRCVLRKIISIESIIGDNVKLQSLIKDNITIGDNSYLMEL